MSQEERIYVSLGKQPVARVDKWKATAKASGRALLQWAAIQLDAAARDAEARKEPAS